MKTDIELKNYYMAFFDILGYNQHISELSDEESHNYADMLSKLIAEAREFIEQLNNSETPDFHKPILLTNAGRKDDGFDIYVRTFSDNIFIFSESTILPLLQYVAFLQARFLTHGIFLRGALHYGQMAIDDNIIFGKGLIKVVGLESKIAHFPRIILSKAFMAELKNHAVLRPSKVMQNAVYVNSLSAFEKQGNKIVDCDIDNNYYIDYLSAWKYFIKGNIVDENSYSLNDLLTDHRKFVEDNLDKYEKNEYILQKYNWVRHYHNGFCEKYQYDLKIN